jgi:hypothetical protein
LANAPIFATANPTIQNFRHYEIADIVPRHFMQTAGDSGVADSLIQAILDDLAARALKTVDAVIETLLLGFRGQLWTPYDAAETSAARRPHFS